MRGSGRAPARNPVGLLDEDDSHARRMCDVRDGDKVSRLYATTCTVTENERNTRLIRFVQVCVRGSERRGDLERLHRRDGATPINPGGAAP